MLDMEAIMEETKKEQKEAPIRNFIYDNLKSLENCVSYEQIWYKEDGRRDKLRWFLTLNAQACILWRGQSHGIVGVRSTVPSHL